MRRWAVLRTSPERDRSLTDDHRKDAGTAAEPQRLIALKSGDKQAFAALVREYHSSLLGMARTMLGEGEAEEAVQDAWIAAYRHIARFEARSTLKTWLTRIVINECRMRMRKHGRELNLDLSTEDQDALTDRFRSGGHWHKPPVAWEFHTPEQMLEERDLQRCLDHHLEQMPENQRMVLQLRDIQGLDFDDICNLLDVSASNVRVLLHRARTTLFAMVEHYQETGEC